MSAFWNSWRPPASRVPPPTFAQLARFHADEASRYLLLADDPCATPYERGRAEYRAAVAVVKAQECARVAKAEALFP